MGTVTENDLHLFFKTQRDLERRFRYARRRELAQLIEHDVLVKLAAMGYFVMATEYGARYDLLVNDCLHVEVKASTWHETVGGRGRYQACLHNRADVVVFCCVNSSKHYFVIPVKQLGGRKNIAVWSYEPARYTGRWAKYLEAWTLLPPMVREVQSERTYQQRLRRCFGEKQR